MCFVALFCVILILFYGRSSMASLSTAPLVTSFPSIIFISETALDKRGDLVHRLW